MKWSQQIINMIPVVTLFVTVTYCNVSALPVSQEQIFVNEGESFIFSCGPSLDPRERISTTLNNNERSEEIVLPINTSADGVALFQYRTTTIEDDNTRIVCTAGQDVGTIHLTVFYAPIINVDANNFTIEEGTRFSIPLSVIANPQPDMFLLRFQNVGVYNVYTNSTTIEFTTISRNQTGEYFLEIANNISTTFYNFTLDVTYPPAYLNPYLPSRCYPVGTNVTYNCSAVSMIEGNPLPSLRANVTYSQMTSLELAGDTVMITDGKMDYRVNVTCIAYNGVSPTATASGFVHFGNVPGPIENIETMPSFKGVIITWDAQNNTGCSQLVRYQGEVVQVDKNETVSSIDTTSNSYTVSNLYQNSQYLISLRGVNELGASSSVNTTVWTKAIEITITALNVRLVESNSVEVTWDFESAGVADFTITVRYQRILDGVPQGDTSFSVSADERTIVLNLEDGNRYRITISVMATNEADVSDTKMTEIDTERPSSGAATKVLTLMTILVLVVVYVL